MYPKVVDICPNIILIVIFIMFTFLHGVWRALHHVVTWCHVTMCYESVNKEDLGFLLYHFELHFTERKHTDQTSQEKHMN